MLFESPSATEQWYIPVPSGILWSCLAIVDRVLYFKPPHHHPQLFQAVPQRIGCAEKNALGNKNKLLNSNKKRERTEVKTMSTLAH